MRRGRKTFPSYDHGEPIRKPDSVVLLLFLSAIALVFIHVARVPFHAVVFDFNRVQLMQLDKRLSVPTENITMIESGEIEWNGTRVSKDELQILMKLTTLTDPEPYVVFTPSAKVAYGDTLPILDIIKQSGTNKFCFGDLQRYEDYDAWDNNAPMTFITKPEKKIPRIDYNLPPTVLDCGPTQAYLPVTMPLIPAIPPPA